MADVLLRFTEEDVSGAKLPLPVVEDNLATDLIRWLHTRGLNASTSDSKTSLVKRVKEILASGYVKFIVDPDKNLSYDIIQSHVNATVPKVSLPLLANWKSSLEDIPGLLNYTHIYEYLAKRTVVILAKDQKVCGTYNLPIADKPLTKGFNFYGSGHVQELKVNCTGEFCHVWGRVMASMKDDIYLSKIVLERNSSVVISGQCNCVAGAGGKCNHIAAVLFTLVEYRDSQRESCTSKPQEWHLPSRSSKRNTKPEKTGVRNPERHIFKRKKERKDPLEGYTDYQAITNLVIDFKKLKEDKENVSHNMGINHILQTTSSSSQEDSFPMNNMTPEEVILTTLKICTQQEADEIEKSTKGQHINLEWHRQRKGRITASICKDCVGKGDPSKIVKKIITVGNPKSKAKSLHMQYGIDNEDIAVNKLEQQLSDDGINTDLRKCGLFVSLDDSQLAASPDRVGRIDDENVIVEVKCLSASRELTPLEATRIKQRDSNFAFRERNGKLTLKTNHRYYYQMLMQMAVTHTCTGYMVVFTKDSVPVEYIKVTFDDELWQHTKETLLDFHYTYVVPALVLQRFGNTVD